ncbi:MAG: hypothetical protein LBH98_03625 [Chitinispirillales bacterium]|jgi:hypothetical protein|nr:hypothetical protein [Chitinispirillales bacterium]
MKFDNIDKLLSEAKEKSRKRLLFDFSFGKIVLKCLLLVDNRVLMMSIKTQPIGHSISFNENDFISAFLPSEFYNSVKYEIKNTYNNYEANSILIQ